eukprot:6846991-Prymnesium_polylepis.1
MKAPHDRAAHLWLSSKTRHGHVGELGHAAEDVAALEPSGHLGAIDLGARLNDPERHSDLLLARRQHRADRHLHHGARLEIEVRRGLEGLDGGHLHVDLLESCCQDEITPALARCSPDRVVHPWLRSEAVLSCPWQLHYELCSLAEDGRARPIRGRDLLR